MEFPRRGPKYHWEWVKTKACVCVWWGRETGGGWGESGNEKRGVGIGSGVYPADQKYFTRGSSGPALLRAAVSYGHTNVVTSYHSRIVASDERPDSPPPHPTIVPAPSSPPPPPPPATIHAPHQPKDIEDIAVSESRMVFLA